MFNKAISTASAPAAQGPRGAAQARFPRRSPENTAQAEASRTGRIGPFRQGWLRPSWPIPKARSRRPSTVRHNP